MDVKLIRAPETRNASETVGVIQKHLIQPINEQLWLSSMPRPRIMSSGDGGITSLIMFWGSGWRNWIRNLDISHKTYQQFPVAPRVY